MNYSASRPPVLTANLGTNIGFTPQMNIVSHAGAVQTLTNANMVQINNTSMWIYKVGDNMTVPSDHTEFMYYITSPAGDVVYEGNFVIQDNSLSLSGSIVSSHVIIPTVVSTTGSITTTKTYPLRFVPLSADGTFLENVAEIGASPTLGPNITINFQNPLNSSNDVIGNMTLGVQEWVFDWTLTYDTPSDIALCTIQCQSNGKDYKYTRVIEIVKPREFNPQRVGVGSVS